ncbi:MAG: XapX protein [Ramlibacter sp.]|nr:XapX protein [Ramlibacter sp.]
MKAYLASIAVGLLVGVVYALFQVRSPAPPVIALVGLLGILLGEQIPPLVRHMFESEVSNRSWLKQQQPHVFGELPVCTKATRVTASLKDPPHA